MTDVLTKEQFEREWRAREKLATVTPAPKQERVRVRGGLDQQLEPTAVVRAFARPLLAAALEALLDFDGVMDDLPQHNQQRRRIRRK